jgi:hypothetical protein
LITLRIDVDYPYPSRSRSFIYTALGVRTSREYLKNSKIIARMINESHREIRAYWFFTHKTMPDIGLLSLLHPSRHEVALHVVNHPTAELELLEKATKRKIEYYTIHGTARLFARIMWRRKLGQSQAAIPKNFPLKSFHAMPTLSLDALCYSKPNVKVIETVESSIAKGEVLEIHPEWLFQRGTINHRGPYYKVLRKVLDVDRDLATLGVRKKGFLRIAVDMKEYERSVVPTNLFLEKLRERGIDVFTFIERGWCCKIPNPPNVWLKTADNVALLQVTTFEDWWKNAGKKTRNMVRKSEKSGVKTEVVEPSEKLAEGIWKIYNETPIRQDRAFPHYGESLQPIKDSVFSAENCTFIGAFFQDELAGFIQLIHGDKIAIASQILSLQRHSDKAVNNALVAKAVEVCAAKEGGWIMYGRMGNHPSLDQFKQSVGFVRFPLTRYYVPLTKKGRFAVRVGLHRDVKDVLPEAIKLKLIPAYNWVSRNQVRIRLRFGF